MRLAPSLLLLLALAGCAGPSPEREPAAPRRPAPSRDELRELRELSAGVIVGKVESYDDLPTGRVYTVRVEEVLSLRPADEQQAATHPLAHDATIKVTSFLFKGGVAGEIGPLEELSRHVFFLAPKETAGEWLNLEDASRHRLPEARETVEALRALRDKPLKEGAGGAPAAPPR